MRRPLTLSGVPGSVTHVPDGAGMRPRGSAPPPARVFGDVARLGHADAVTTSRQQGEGASAAAGPALDVALDLGAQLADLAFPLELPGVDHARALRRRVAAQLDTHLVPRLRQASLPTIVVVGGPTGSGKSTLVNAVAGSEVTATGVVRPTTRRPVLVARADDVALLADHPVLDRSTVVTADVPRGLVLLDAPDLDSVEEANRTLAVELVEVADVWLFVTTATRYGDAVPWTVLEAVRRRGITVGVVLDRAPADALDTVRRDLLTRLDGAGLGSVPLFVVPDAGPLTGPLAPGYAHEVADWLRLVATRAGSRELVARTIRGVWSPLRREVRELLDAVVAQTDAAATLAAAAAAAVPPVADELEAALRTGALADGAPTTRWLAAAASRGPLEPLAHEVAGMFARRRVARSADARQEALTSVLDDVRAGFEDVVGQAAAHVAEGVRAAWTEHSEAGAVLATERSETQVMADRSEQLARAWHAWLGAIAGVAPAQEPGAALVAPEGARTLVALAAVGLTGARNAVRRMDEARDAVVVHATETLVAAAREVLEAEAAAAVTQVSRQLSPDTATALRVRVGELRRLAGED